ncbi:MAG: hypothetical protein AAGA65_28120 [Actinomycetota bacterium]
MKWSQRDRSLVGRVEELDRLDELPDLVCADCQLSFDSIRLVLDDLAVADSNDVEALGRYCRDVASIGRRIRVHTARPALRRLLVAGPVRSFMAAEGDDPPSPGEPYTCPHRP